jgi:uncharacterized RDD family membrane protein YckC
MTEACPRCGLDLEEACECPGCGLSLARYRSRLATAQHIAPVAAAVEVATRPAGLWIRGAALLVDNLVLLGAEGLLGILLGAVWGEGSGRSPVLRPAQAAFPVLFFGAYASLCHWLWGQTAGKALVGVRVVRVDGGAVGLGQSVARFVVWVLSLLALGAPYLLAAVRADRRALHDLAAGTRVERTA